MEECPLTERCVFFNGTMEKMPMITEALKKRYCRDEYKTCARFILANSMGREHVPKDLFPNDTEKLTDFELSTDLAKNGKC